MRNSDSRLRLSQILFQIILWCMPAYGAATLQIQQLKLQPGENVITAAVMDEAHGIAYVATAESDFKFSLEESAARVIRITLRQMRRVESLQLKPGDNPLRAGIINRSGTHAYFGIYGDPNKGVAARIVGISLIRWRPGPQVTLGKEDFGISSGVIDPVEDMAYFGTLFGNVAAIHLPDMRIVASLSLQKEDNAFQCAVIDPLGQYGYFGTSSGNIMKIRLSDFSPAGNITALRGEKGFRTAVMAPDGVYAYFGTEGVPAKIVRISLSDFRPAGALTLEEGENKLIGISMNVKKGRLYVATETIPAKIVQIRLSSFERMGSLDLPAQVGKVTLLLDRTYHDSLVLGSGENPSRILKITPQE